MQLQNFGETAARTGLTAIRPLLQRLPVLRNRHFFLFDVLTVAFAPALALVMRIEDPGAVVAYQPSLLFYTALALLFRLPVFFGFGLYRRFWSYATVDELAHICLAVVGSSVALMVSFWATGQCAWMGSALPRSIPYIESLIILMLVGGSRFSVRLLHYYLRPQPTGDVRKVLIMGAGDAGQMIARELLANPQLGFQPVAFLDDDRTKHGFLILNIPVLGSRKELAETVRTLGIAQVVIAMPTAPGKVIRDSLSLCEKAGVPAKTVPGMYEILSDSVSVSHLRNVQIEDLLRRDPIRTEVAAVRELIRGKRVLVTGGGGSIGSELCRQVLQCAPEELCLLGHGENSVFESHASLQILRGQLGFSAGEGPQIRAVIADIRSIDRIRQVVREFRPDIIFHAAAHKHVPLMEMHPTEAVDNNVLGTKNLLDAALEYDVDRFVMVSTDKAVNPTSVMGATKRAAELLVLRAARQSGKPYVAVRFGNVLGSRGSVVLTFRKQIAAGGPVTVSDPEMRRYFMTIPEAVQLVLQSSVLGQGGEIFVLDMGEPVRIVDLARDLIELSGLQVGRDIDIVFSGIRPGEKLYEELFIEGENYRPTRHEKILIASNASAFVPEGLDEVLAEFRDLVARDDASRVVPCLKRLIPEFNHESMSASPAAEACVPRKKAGTSSTVVVNTR